MEYTQYKSLPDNYVVEKINEFLLEDMPDGDKTTEGIFSSKQISKAYIQAEEDLVFAGEFVLPYFFPNHDSFALNFCDGDPVKSGDIIAKVEAPTEFILKRERVLLNLIQRLCGIATLTEKYAKIAKPYRVKILDTRKTTPGLRLFEKYAVTCGGGYNHRLNLSAGILIKDNHIKAAGGIKQAVSMIKSLNYGLKVELEVDNLEQLQEGLEIGVDGFLLDNMSVKDILQAVFTVREYLFGDKIFIEASGGITLNTLSEYVKTGVNAISVGALTHSSKSSNIHIEFD